MGRLHIDSTRGGSELTIRARHLIDSIRDGYVGTPLAEPAQAKPTVGLKSV
jgi:hypothetical protein